MGGGKSRALCEVVFNEMLDHPGLKAVLARAQHTSIIETTKKTMVEQVIPPDLITHRKQSGGEDYLQLWNGSVCHFIGLDDPTAGTPPKSVFWASTSRRRSRKRRRSA
jgi:hypothetical protein